MPSLDRALVDRFRDVISRRFGLRNEDDKLSALADLVRLRADALGFATPGAYVDHLPSLPRRAEELQTLADLLTVNETYFFRNSDNFRALSEHVLPDRVHAMSPSRSLRVLSAGCSSGEEPYSLAIAIREVLPELDRWNVEIRGIDRSPQAIAKARRGQYTAWSLRASPESMRQRYFRGDGRDFVLDPRIQAMVTLEVHNLLDESPSLWRPEYFDLVFCRNVLMYFMPEAMGEIVRRIGRSLRPGGFLFLGHAETLRGLSQGFHLCHTHDTFYYQKRDARAGQAIQAAPLAQPREPAIEALPHVIEGAASWVDAIKQASERIAALSRTPAPGPDLPDRALPYCPTPATRSWDLGLVLEAMRQERFQDALVLLSALPPDSHADPDAQLLRAVLLSNDGQLREAEAACARLLEIDDLNAGAHYVMALCREHAGRPAEAAEHDRTAIYLDPGFAMPHLHLGLMARRAGDDAAARHALAEAHLLLAREDASRLLLFGGGFSREALAALCRTELRAVGGDP